MIGRGAVAVAALGGVLVLGGCGSSNGGSAEPAGQSTNSAEPSLAANAPSGYDPCSDIPQSVLDSEQLVHKEVQNDTASGGVQWRGCTWVQAGGDGYSVAIRTTNLTVEAVRGKNFPEAQELTIGSRSAISTRQFDGPHIKEACTLNVEIKGGTLEFNVNNPASRSTGNMDSCQIAKTLGEKVIPTLPSSV
ncbi:DUF3558 domain-containing protein [Nocardia sp. BSTN01]|uniref:DUF3558 domain-containing protein n=1 Tax=Nocardia sp. BSTN01 TaxID=2783665 RepID=UPI00189082B1|nr:DUF3558 domain-containing protein [Nocardia sp. BSTN01]MBF4999776.1 DUF3558 domain-containing protein [Nocardia sp. BSTN01]